MPSLTCFSISSEAGFDPGVHKEIDMKTLALGLAGALAFGMFATVAHADSNWTEKDRSEIYRVQRQQVYSDRGRYDRDRYDRGGYYAAPREEYYGYDDRPYEEPVRTWASALLPSVV